VRTAAREVDFVRYQRSAFTLLEMVLALALTLVLLLALYFTLNTYLTSASIGRDTVAEGEIARSVMNRIAADINAQMGAFDPRPLAGYSPTGPTTTPGSATTSGWANTLNSNTNLNSTTGLAPVIFNVGLQGTNNYFILTSYRVQPSPTGAPTNVPDPIVTSDLRRVSYWLINNGGAEPAGLARQEVKQATSTDIIVLPTDLSDQNNYLIAKEVKSVTFQYTPDGQNYLDTWDGTYNGGGTSGAGEDGTPPGPPLAIRVRIAIRRTPSVGDPPPSDGSQDLQFEQIIAIPGANNPNPFIPSNQ
jgi:hypothetical protein